MRNTLSERMERLHDELLNMSALCEQAISIAVKALTEKNPGSIKAVKALESDINAKQSEIESMCFKIILREQPVASDLRKIIAAQQMVVDMERIGDQALDIAEITQFTTESKIPTNIHISNMARESIKMLDTSIDSYVKNDLELARSVTEYDDIVDDLFQTVRKELIDVIGQNHNLASECIDLIMVAKYLERIGDHSENIAEWVIYSITGERILDIND